MSVLVVGDFMHDLDERVSLSRVQEGVPVYQRESLTTRPGGAGNVAATLRRLGVEVETYGEQFGLHRKHRVICDGKTILRLDNDLPIDHRSWRIECEPEAVIVCDHAKGIITEKSWAWVVGAFSCPIYADPHKSRPLDFYRGAAALFPNREEARGQKPRRGVVKLDRDGVMAYWDGGERHYPAGELSDPCGAGDVLLAGTVAATLRVADWFEAVREGVELVYDAAISDYQTFLLP